VNQVSPQYRDREWLAQQYESGKSQSRIALECGVDPATISNWMRKHKIPARDMHECHVGRANGAWVDTPFKDKTMFEYEYIERGLSLRQIATKYGVSLRTAARWLHNHGIRPRTQEEWLRTHPRPKGEKNPNWKGGISFPRCAVCGRPISFGSRLCHDCYMQTIKGAGNPNYKGIADIMILVREWAHDKWRPLVFARDNYRCQKCGDARGGNLHAHHIVPLSVLVNRVVGDAPCDAAEQRMALARKAIEDPLIRAVSNGATLCETCHREVHRV